MRKCTKLFALLSIIMCFASCDFSQHPTGNPRQDAETLHQMMKNGDIQGANQFLDEVRDLYLQDFVNDRGTKLDEFWEWNAKMK